MSGSLNKLTLIGNVTRDPEVRSLQNGGKVVNFSVATGESWTDKESGERKEITQFHNIVIWNEQIQSFVERFVKKGMKVYVEGALQTRKYTAADGTEKLAVETVLQRFNGSVKIMSSPRGASEGAENESHEQPQERTETRTAAPAGRMTRTRAAVAADSDDEIPF